MIEPNVMEQQLSQEIYIKKSFQTFCQKNLFHSNVSFPENTYSVSTNPGYDDLTTSH